MNYRPPGTQTTEIVCRACGRRGALHAFEAGGASHWMIPTGWWINLTDVLVYCSGTCASRAASSPGLPDQRTAS